MSHAMVTGVTSVGSGQLAPWWSAGSIADLVGARLLEGDPASLRFALDGPAGTGKTTALTRVVLRGATERGWEDVALLTFSRNVVASVRERLKEHWDSEDSVRTLHSACARLLRLGRKGEVQGPTGLWGPYLDLDVRAHRRAFVAEVVGRVWGGRAPGRKTWERYVAFDAFVRSIRVPPRDGIHGTHDRHIAADAARAQAFCELYAAFRERHALVDYTDLLELVLERGVSLPQRIVLLDEAQDFSPLEWAVVNAATAGADCVVAAGDAAQAIYFFKGARVRDFLEFGGARLQLTTSHRVPRKLMAIAEHSARQDPQLQGRASIDSACDGGEIFLLDRLEDVTWTGGRYLVLARNRRYLNRLEQRLEGLMVPFHGTCGRGIPREEKTVKAIQAIRDLRRGLVLNGGRAFELICGTQRRLWARSARERALTRGFQVTLESIDVLTNGSEGGRALREAETAYLLDLPDRQREYLHALAALHVDDVLHPDFAPLVTTETIHGAKGLECDFAVIAGDWSRLSFEELMCTPAAEHRVAHVALTRASKAVLLLPPKTWRRYPMPQPRRWFARGDLDHLLDEDLVAGIPR